MYCHQSFFFKKSNISYIHRVIAALNQKSKICDFANALTHKQDISIILCKFRYVGNIPDTRFAPEHVFQLSPTSQHPSQSCNF